MLLVAVCSLLFAGCTYQTHTVHLRYPQFIRTEKLADKTYPQIVVVSKFNDARRQTILLKWHPGLLPIHNHKFDTPYDVSTIVRRAFVVGLLISGFEVPMPDEQGTNPFLNIAGKIITYKANIRTGLTKYTITADIAIEVTITSKTGSLITFMVRGRTERNPGRLIGTEYIISDLLDQALQECVEKFLEDAKFRGLLKS